MSEVNLFVRKASGLVRAWSVFDAFIYATFSINLITLGLFIFSYCWYFGGSLGTAVVVGGAFTIFEERRDRAEVGQQGKSARVRRAPSKRLRSCFALPASRAPP